MSDSGEAPSRDSATRFLFEYADIRGEYASLDRSYRDMVALHQYPPAVSRLLGEFLAAAVLLSTTLKFAGRLIVQARSDGQVPLLMAECDHQLNVRGIARGAQQATSSDNSQLLRNGQLAITIDPLDGQRYQGIVALEQGSLADSLETYFRHSEQLYTRFWLAADEERACGMLLQQLPAQLSGDTAVRAQQWEHACSLASTLRTGELLREDASTLLHRLYHQDPLRVFAPRPLRFQCSCSRERSLGALLSLGRSELEDMLREMDVIAMDCEFCNQQYRFRRRDLAPALGEPGGDSDAGDGGPNDSGDSDSGNSGSGKHTLH